MILKTAAIEIKRSHPRATVIGLHPGTVDTPLSKPFQNNIPSKQLISPQQSANYLLSVIENASPEFSGKCYAWDGQEILP